MNIFLIFISTLPLIWTLYTHIPYIIFGLDYVEGNATILKANEKIVEFKYFHKRENREYILSYHQKNIKNVKKLKDKKNGKLFTQRLFQSMLVLSV